MPDRKSISSSSKGIKICRPRFPSVHPRLLQVLISRNLACIVSLQIFGSKIAVRKFYVCQGCALALLREDSEVTGHTRPLCLIRLTSQFFWKWYSA